jgi:hypothetical protein
MNKKREHVKNKINELATSSKNNSVRKVYRGSEFKRSYQSIINLVMDKHGDLLADSHNI